MELNTDKKDFVDTETKLIQQLIISNCFSKVFTLCACMKNAGKSTKKLIKYLYFTSTQVKVKVPI